METLGLFAMGFAAGWAVRSGVDSSRKLAVAAIAAAYEVGDRARRWVAIEREHLEDLVAEGRALYETRARRPGNAPHGHTPRAANESGAHATHAA